MRVPQGKTPEEVNELLTAWSLRSLGDNRGTSGVVASSTSTGAGTKAPSGSGGTPRGSAKAVTREPRDALRGLARQMSSSARYTQVHEPEVPWCAVVLHEAAVFRTLTVLPGST